MVKEVVVLCDPCLAQGTSRAATRVGVRVQVGDTKPLLLDLCSGHYRRIVEPMVNALAIYGYPEDKPAVRQRDHRTDRTTGPFLCQVKDCNWGPLKHYATLWQHIRGVHGMTIGEYREQYGDPTPMTAEEVATFSLTVECELDDCDETWSTSKGHRWPRRAMEQHMWGVHGVKAARVRE
jgi:hypothetical protein